MPCTATTVRDGGASGAPYRKVARVPPSTSTGTGVGAVAGERMPRIFPVHRAVMPVGLSDRGSRAAQPASVMRP